MKKILVVMVLLLGLIVRINNINAASMMNAPGNQSHEQEIALDEVFGPHVCLIDNFGILYYLEIGNGKITGMADNPHCASSFKVTGGYEGTGFRMHLRVPCNGDCVNYLYEGAMSNLDTKTAEGRWRNTRKSGKGWFTLTLYTGDNQDVISKSEAGCDVPGLFLEKKSAGRRKGGNSQISLEAVSGSILDVFGPTILMKDNYNIEYDLTLFDDGRILGAVTHICCGTYTTKEGVRYSYHNNKDFAFYLIKDTRKDFCDDKHTLKCVDYTCEGRLIGTSTLSGTWENVLTSQASYYNSIGAFVMTAVASPNGVYGKVTDFVTNVGIPGATVSLKDKEYTAEVATTDSGGNYTLQDAWIGKEYTLVASANDYWEKSLSCRVDKTERNSGKECNFSLNETKTPIVIFTNPSDGSSEISLNAVITATFSEPMDSGTISEVTFLLNSKETLRIKSKKSRKKWRKSVVGAVTYDATKKTAIFTPASMLSSSTTYEATITTGVKNIAGSNMLSPYKWSFRTELNEAPKVNAGTDQNINVGAVASLDGTVTDDGLPKGGTLITLWTQLSGAGTVSFGNASKVDTTASFSTSGVYVLELKADDGSLTATDTVTINVNAAPAVNAGLDQNINFGETVSLDGTVTDDGLPVPPGALTTLWTQLSGTGTVSFGNASAVDTTASFSSSGVYVLELRASDGGLTTSDTVTISVNSVTFTLTIDVAGVQGDTPVYVNGASIGNLLLNDGAGYLTNTFDFDRALLRDGDNEIFITSPLSSGTDVYDDIQIKNMKLKNTNKGEVVFTDGGTYHIGDQTIAEITESYNSGTWTDPNPPAFWTELIETGRDLTVPFNLTLN